MFWVFVIIRCTLMSKSHYKYTALYKREIWIGPNGGKSLMQKAIDKNDINEIRKYLQITRGAYVESGFLRGFNHRGIFIMKKMIDQLSSNDIIDPMKLSIIFLFLEYGVDTKTNMTLPPLKTIEYRTIIELIPKCKIHDDLAAHLVEYFKFKAKLVHPKKYLLGLKKYFFGVGEKEPSPKKLIETQKNAAAYLRNLMNDYNLLNEKQKYVDCLVELQNSKLPIKLEINNASEFYIENNKTTDDCIIC